MDEVCDPTEIWDLSSPMGRSEMQDIQANYYRSLLGVQLKGKIKAQIEFLEEKINNIRNGEEDVSEGVVKRLETLLDVTKNVKEQKEKQFGAGSSENGA